MDVKQVVWAVIALAGAAAGVQAQAPGTAVELTGRVQVQWNSTSVDDVPAATTFETRRVRLGTRLTVDDWISGMLEADFALGRLQLKQAWAQLELDPAFVLRAGQFKKPFSRIALTSSAQHAMIERGARIRGLDDVLRSADPVTHAELRGELLLGEAYTLVSGQGYADYDMGVTVGGVLGGLEWAAGVFNGSGPDTRDENDGKSAAARVSYGFAAGAPVDVAVAWSRREVKWPGASSPWTRMGDAFELSAELGGFRSGWWLIAETTVGDNIATNERFTAAQAVLSRFMATGGDRLEGVEPLGRLSWGDPDDEVDGDSGMLVTPGVNLYFAGRNRLMFNWDVYVPSGDGVDAQHAARAQINLHF